MRKGTLRDQQKTDTRRRLVEAADRVFHRRGYTASTIDEIVTEAGASRPTFYLHFQSKAAVAAALWANIDPEVRAFSECLDALDPPTHGEIRRWLGDVLEWYAHNRVRVEASEQALVAEPAVAEASFGYTQQAIDAMPRYLARFPGRARQRARLRMLALIMQLNRIAYFMVVQGCAIDREAMLELLADDWYAVLGPARP